MTIRLTAYETTACAGFQIKKTIEELQEALIKGWCRDITGNNNKLYELKQIDGSGSMPNSIPPFAHPVIVVDKSFKEDVERIIIDARPYGSVKDYEFHAKNTIEYNLQSLRAQLTHVWKNMSVAILRDISPMAMSVYASWISEAISRRLALDARVEMELAILAAIFYNSHFVEKAGELHETEKIRLASTIARNLRLPADEVFIIIDKISYVEDIKDFCEKAGEVIENVRLKELNSGLLLSILSNSWFGTNAKETISVAIEHPPTWISILYASTNERTFKNSVIGKITERNSYREASSQLARSITKLVDDINKNDDRCEIACSN